jgi:hypothetical protein
MNATPLARLFACATVFAAAAATAPLALADTEGTQRTRAEVKAETLAAMKAGLIVAGEGSPTLPMPVATKTREERKAETMVARNKGELVHGGLATYRASISQQTATAKSTKTRAERKAETMDAIQHKQMMPAGEAA